MRYLLILPMTLILVLAAMTSVRDTQERYAKITEKLNRVR
jgi:hypothetical protein